MKFIYITLAMLIAIPSFGEQGKNHYLLENGLDVNLPNAFAMLRDNKTGCKLVVQAESDKHLAKLSAIKEVCPDGLARPAKGSVVMPYGARGVIEHGTDVWMTVSY